MQFFEHFSLTTCNTFGIRAMARYFAAPESEAELARLLCSVTARNIPLMVLGGGSNIVFRGDFDGLVIHPSMRGVRCLEESTTHFLVEASAGEVWHDFVQFTLSQRWYGLENLSLIPGSVGACPIQNIGAYGVEITDVLHSLTAIEIATGKLREFAHGECGFGYRDSVFKGALRDRYIITRVRFLLRKAPAVNTAYGDIRAELASQGIDHPTPRQVAEAVIAIRSRKLPSPAVIGNAGSFFKNPVVTPEALAVLKAKWPTVVAYPQGEKFKLAAGWLIDQAGWKGRRIGPVGSYERQALVLVNHGGATGADVMRTAQAIQADVRKQFDVELEMEPLLYGGA
ncbi:MAG TPA: UDP-N-acetylmuramate dehydrogenase [Moraxellaceae bacterium]|nr:UDP-N-acetylmuramate dehydrogenase [Moraxellaceae bacterium]